MSSSFSRDQLQSDDTLDDRGVDDVLDEGMSPPERPSPEVAHARTAAEDAAGETLDERIAQEEPDLSDEVDDGDERSGRLASDPGDADDVVAQDVGIDGGAASAEEAAVHTVEEDEA